MAKIRKDVGTVLAFDQNGLAVMLKPGSRVPAGVTVGDHVLDTASIAEREREREREQDADGDETEDDGDQLEVPAKNGTNEAWHEYAKKAVAARGLNIEIPEDAGRGDVIEALEAAGIPTE